MHPLLAIFSAAPPCWPCSQEGRGEASTGKVSERKSPETSRAFVASMIIPRSSFGFAPMAHSKAILFTKAAALLPGSARALWILKPTHWSMSFESLVVSAPPCHQERHRADVLEPPIGQTSRALIHHTEKAPSFLFIPVFRPLVPRPLVSRSLVSIDCGQSHQSCQTALIASG